MTSDRGSVSRGTVSTLGMKLSALLFMLTVALAISAATASAAERYGPISGRIGEIGPGGLSNGEFSSPDGVAIDQATGDVYVVDTGNNRIEEFEASGAYFAQFNGAATPAGTFSSPTAIAVNQSTGDVYVVDTGNNVVDKFTSSGGYLCEISGWERGCQVAPTEPPTFSAPTGVAVDPTAGGGASEDIYVSDRGNRIVDVFTATGDDASQFSPGYKPWSLAVDSDSDVYVAGAGAEQVNEYTALGSELITEYREGALDAKIRTVGVGLMTNNVFLLAAEPEGSGSLIYEFDTHSQPVPSAGQNIFGNGLVSAPPEAEFSPGISVNSASGTVYVADPLNNVVDMFAPVTVPDATTGSVSGVGLTSATVEGLVNAHGTGGAEYFFQYGKSTAYESETEHTSVGTGEAEAAAADLAALEPGTTYHYRLNTTNSSGIVSNGEDHTFTTAPLPPTALLEEILDLTTNGVVFRGEVLPGNDPATYHFEYGPTSNYGQVLPDIGIGVGTTPIPVEQASPTDLVPGRTYHYRLVAVSGAGESIGLDQTFETPTSVSPATTPPTVSVTAIAATQTEVTFAAAIGPGGYPTTYTFELGSAAGNYESRTFGNIAGEPGVENITATLTNLRPGTVYHYRLLAANAAGTAVTPDQTFLTGSLGQSITIPPSPLLVPIPSELPAMRTTLKCKKGFAKHGSRCVRKKRAKPRPKRRHHR